MKKLFLLFHVLGFSIAYSQCNIIYVTPTGTGAGTTVSPASLSNALSLATNGTVIRLAVGTYTIDNAITLTTDGVSIEGGFDPALAWRKTSTAGATVISRSALNPEGAANQQRLVAIYAIGRSNFRFQDITIQTANATGNGMSTYGMHLTSCSNYNIVRCQILPGNASAGAGDDNVVTYNSAWDGANGSNGGNGATGGGPQCTCSLSTDNGGSGGGGGAAGTGGANAAPIGGSAGNGSAGGAGGAGRPDNSGANGFAGTAGGGPAPGAGGTGGSQDGNGNATSNVGNGGNGGAGTNGTNGANGVAAHTAGYFVPGAGTNGTSGTGGSGGGGGGGAGRDTDACDAAGGGGSGGGGGGGGGGAARGGFGGGGAFGIYLYNNGANGNVIQSRVLAGAGGAAGLGGRGGNGGNGGTSTIGNGCTNGDTDGNRGGSGGSGGVGGAGGNGGNGSTGVSINIHLNGGTGLVTNDNAFNLAAQPVITMQNTNCTYENITFTAPVSAPWSFAGCSSPAGPTGASVITQYTCTGRNNVTYNGNQYTGFAYISCARSTSTISPTACTNYTSPSGLYNYSATGLYSDTITNAQGCDSVIAINLTILGTTALQWNAGASTTVWGTAANWNSCGTPVCGVDAFVNPAAQQPVLTAGTYAVKDLTINAGATVTLQNGATLQICGNLTNNGTLVCQAGSTVEFIGTGLQTISGNFPASQFHNFTVTKNTGSVIINNDIVINGNFTTTNNTSVFNNNNRNIQLSGNFLNANGNTTFTNSGTTGGLYFVGTNAQIFNEGVTQLDLNLVNINKAANGVTLNTNMNIKTITGVLQLLNGNFTTGTFHIEVANTAATSVNAGSTSSYVNGNLWRAIDPVGGSYDFPVGSSTWYERVNINLVGANTYTQLRTRYDNWPGGPNILGLAECSATYSLPSEDHGYWTINQTGGNTGNYNATLYCFGATNTAGASGWTVQKANSVAGPWSLSGTCDMTSTAAVVRRNNMVGFSVFAAAQSPTPLPVELLSFTGNPEGWYNHLFWTTATEVNNNFFVLERSNDGVNYDQVATVNGAGNSNTLINYHVVDERPFSTTYYQLKQYDYNGSSETFGPIVVANNSINGFSFISVFPNPAEDIFYINLSSGEAAELNYFITDAFGKQVYNGIAKIEGNTKIEVNASTWAAGVYFVRLTSNHHNYERTIKLIVK
jgi:hypothetical protein